MNDIVFVTYNKPYTMASQKSEPIPVPDFLQKAGINEILTDLHSYFSKQPLVVSDVKDEKGNQYVDLVQEGGGVLGVALVGYTYVLEKMGIRFFSLAGTSAGSINAMLLASCGNKEDEKMEKVIDHLLKLDMFSLVDGKSSNWKFTKSIKKLIQQALLKKNFFSRITSIIKYSVLLFFILMTGSFIINFFNPEISKWIGLAAGILLLTFIIIVLIFISKFKWLSKNGYGLNEGKIFLEWINSVIATNNIEDDPTKSKIETLSDFAQHYMRVPPGMTVIPDPNRSNNDPPVMPMLTIITSDITSERKIEFPSMWDLYWKSQQDARPGDFVRASMSIPVFFETYTASGINQKSSLEIWQKHLNWQNSRLPDKVQFIDGGTLSNFPINVFYNPNYPVPRMPTFGIRLQDGVLDAVQSNSTLFKYIASIFSTIRFNFDRDFITKNRAYNLGVKEVDVRQHSWLNFFMKDDEKIELFRKGALAAAEFLKTFNWSYYKTERLKNFEIQVETFEDPNNLKVFPHTNIK